MLLVRVATWTVAAFIALFAVEVFGGIMMLSHGGGFWEMLHRQTWHLIALAVVPVIGLSLAALISRPTKHGWIRLVGRVLLAVVTLALTYNTGFTGYLGPSAAPDIDEKTLLRFRAFHEVAEPVLLGALLAYWWLSLRGAGGAVVDSPGAAQVSSAQREN